MNIDELIDKLSELMTVREAEVVVIEQPFDKLNVFGIEDVGVSADGRCVYIYGRKTPTDGGELDGSNKSK